MNDLQTGELGLTELTELELDQVNGGLLFLLAGAAAFTTGFFAGYGAVRLVQDLRD